MRASVLALVAFAGCAPAAVAVPTPTTGARSGSASGHVAAIAPRSPIAVLVETDPWATVIGAEQPRLAFYDDGLVLVSDPDGVRDLVLPAAARDALIDALHLDQVAAEAGVHTLDPATDQPTYRLHVWRGGCRATVTVYGRLYPSELVADDPAVRREAQRRVAAPPAFLAARERLIAIEPVGVQAWRPEIVEALLSPSPTGQTRAWPADWPGVDAPEARHHPGGLISVSLPVAHLGALRRLARAGAVAIAGRTWALAYRVPFPAEARWREAVEASACTHHPTAP